MTVARFILFSMLVTLANMECQQIKGKLHSCDRFVRTSDKYSDLMEMTFDDEEEDFLLTFFLANQPPKVTLLVLEDVIKKTGNHPPSLGKKTKVSFLECMS